VAYACNPNYLDQEDCSSRPAQENSSQDPISKITTTKWTGGVVQTVQHLFWKCKPQSHHKKKKTTKLFNDYAAIYDLWV
jgi:hypothetical protein